MKLFQKISLITIIYMYIGNIRVQGMAATNGIITVLSPLCIASLAQPLPNAPTIDFNTIAIGQNVPKSLQPKLYRVPIIGAPDRSCVYFTVNSAGNWPVAGFVSASEQEINADDTNIYFPIDGSQPETAEAARYSCANMDNREDSPVTKWYMQMFGVIPFQNTEIAGLNDYIKAGWNNTVDSIPQAIITFPIISRENNIANELDSSSSMLKLKIFKNNFRKIASTSAGRILLYRILIEIRKHQPNRNSDVSRSEVNSIQASAQTNANIKMDTLWGSFLYGYTNVSILSFSIQIPVIRRECDLDNHTKGYDSSLSITIFNDMNNWYRHLLNVPTTLKP